MPTRKTKAPAKPAKKATRSVKARAKDAQPAARKRPAARKPPSKSDKLRPLDLSAFPPESVSVVEKRICFACILDIFTRHLGLSSTTANVKIRQYIPTLTELYASPSSRPWFTNQPKQDVCPYCGSPAKWHTTLTVYRIESGKATDALRREFVKSLPRTGGLFEVLEERATHQHAFFEWLEKIAVGLDLDNPVWLREISIHYLSRREPKTDWQSLSGQIHAIRRSRRLESGWEMDQGRLFLSPLLFDELLLVQYLVSRSHRAGGLTLEGRYTLAELIKRLRNSGYLRTVGISAQNPDEALEQLVAHLGGGEVGLTFYHILDRRDFLARLKSLQLARLPRPKAPPASS
jgi:hypothetical protein